MTISRFRYIPCTIPALYANSVKFLEDLLYKEPKARIIHIISHEQRRGFHLVVNEDGTKFTDEFGLEVYIARDIDWQGQMTDIDERYEGTGLLPF